jgi:hypothetical protein
MEPVKAYRGTEDWRDITQLATVSVPPRRVINCSSELAFKDLNQTIAKLNRNSAIDPVQPNWGRRPSRR